MKLWRRNKRKGRSCLGVLLALGMITAPMKVKRVSAEESAAECVMEMYSRRILYETHGDIRLPMASTTKIVTAATVLSACEDLQEKVVIPQEAQGVEGSSVYLKKDEIYTVEELLYGLMLRSGNDCATALAIYNAGSIDAFSAKMNETAQKAGALHSNFKNPHGLPCKGHYTTARDLTAITCYAMQNPKFCEIVATKYYEPRGWRNKNKMLTRYEGGIGVKTGYTQEAGRCLVTAATRRGMTLVCTVLNSPTMYEQTEKLLDDAFNAYEYTCLLTENQEFSFGNQRGESKETFSYPLLKEELCLIEYKIIPTESSTNREILGYLEISVGKRLLFSTNLYKL